MRKLIFVLFSLTLSLIGYSQKESVQKEDVFKNANQLIIDADFCAVNIQGSNSSDISFKSTIKSEENLEAYDVETKFNDGVLNISVKKPDQWKSHWGEISLVIPPNIIVDATSQSGKIEINNAKGIKLNFISKSGHINLKASDGQVSIQSPAGDLSVNGFKGNIKSRTKSGAVNISDIDGTFDIGCRKGNINISNAKGKLLVDGGEGKLDVENIEGDISLKSSSGDAFLSIANGNISCRTFDGDLKLFNTKGVHHVESSTGNITGTRVSFTESSSLTSTEGNIKVQLESKENLSFVLKSENSYLRAMGKSKKKSLKIGKGDIVITGTSKTGSQAYY